MKSNFVNDGTASVRILLVEDFAIFRTLVAEILNKQPGYQIVAESADGLDAVQKARDLQPDLVLLDIGLPGLGGLSVARRIRLCSPSSTILFVTANNDRELARHALEAGAHGYVLKVDIVAELVEAVQAVLSGNRFLSRRLKEFDANEDR